METERGPFPMVLPLATRVETPLGNQNLLHVLRVVAQRVADRSFSEMLDGRARTDGQAIWLPLRDVSFTHYELIGLAAHEGAHVRFHTVFDINVHEDICPENPAVGKAVLNVLEDARIDRLLKIAYEGFWMDLDRVNHRLLVDSVARLAAHPPGVLHGDHAVDFLVSLMCIHTTGNGGLFYHDRFRNADGSFKFADPALGSFWDVVLAADKYIRSRPVFPAILVAGKMVIDAMRALLHEGAGAKGMPPLPPGEHAGAGTPPELPAGAGTKVPASRALQSQRVSRLVDSSGVASEETTSDEQDCLERVRLVVLDPPSTIEGVLREVEKDVDQRVDALHVVLESLRRPASSLPVNPARELEFLEDAEGKRKVIVDIIDQVEELRDFNNIENPTGHYELIVARNRHTIQQLRQALAAFHVQPRMTRGMRRGITCTRDLARVVSSGGKFDRPFMTNHEKSGACLLILVDESMSMSQDDMGGLDDGDGSCPMKGCCPVLAACDDRDECDDAGSWPKECDTCMHEDACPMQARCCANGQAADDELAGTRIHVAKKSTIILAEALKNTRIDFAVIGFSAFGGQNKIVEKIYKGFDEPVNPHKLGSIWVSETSPENRDGTSMLVARRHFSGIQNKHPIMIIISDGEPYHGGTDYVGETAVTMTATAVNTVKQTARLFALSIDKRGDDYLERIYGKDRFFVVNDGRDVSRVLIYLVKTIAAGLRG